MPKMCIYFPIYFAGQPTILPTDKCTDRTIRPFTSVALDGHDSTEKLVASIVSFISIVSSILLLLLFHSKDCRWLWSNVIFKTKETGWTFRGVRTICLRSSQKGLTPDTAAGRMGFKHPATGATAPHGVVFKEGSKGHKVPGSHQTPWQMLSVSAMQCIWLPRLCPAQCSTNIRIVKRLSAKKWYRGLAEISKVLLDRWWDEVRRWFSLVSFIFCYH